MARAVVLAAFLVAAVAAPLTGGALRAEPPRQGFSVTSPYGQGEALYLRDCASCHGAAGEGTARGVPLQSAGAAGAHYYLSTGRMPISDPDDRVQRSEPTYSEAEIQRLVEYVASLGDGPPLPKLGGRGDLATGGVLFRQHCAQCHGSSGVGVALAAGVVAPSLLQSTPAQVAEALTIGPGAMPVFDPAVFDADEVQAVVAYVERLKHPPDAGGHPLARSGRLDEALVAWGAGGALLMVAARAIARRR